MNFPSPKYLLVITSCLAAGTFTACRHTEPATSHVPKTGIYFLTDTNPIPLTVEDTHLYLQGTINGNKAKLSLDTGSTLVAVNDDSAERLELTTGKSAVAHGFGGSGRVARTKIKTMSVGAAKAENIPGAIVNFPRVFDFDALLGLAFLSGYVTTIDYANGTLQFRKEHAPGEEPAGIKLPLHFLRGVIAVEAQVDGIPGLFVIDTGAGQNLILNPWFVKEHNFLETYTNSVSTFTGVGLFGEMKGHVTWVRQLSLGSYVVTNFYAEFDVTEKPNPSKRIAGTIGADILARFNITLDVKNLTAWFEPNKHYTDPPKPSALLRSGFVLWPEGKNYIVKSVVPHSPADIAGIKAKDSVLSVNGQSAAQIPFHKLKTIFRAAEGTEVKVHVQTPDEPAREATVVLRDVI